MQWLSILFLLLVSISSAYKILVFSPATSKSHLISNGRIADELARAGHNVTLLEVDFLGIVDSTKSAKLVKKTIVRTPKGMQQFRDVLQGFSEVVMKDGGLFDLLQGNIQYQSSYNALCEELLERDDVFESLKAENFDGFFAEQLNICGFGYAKALGIERRFLISSCPFFAHVYDYTSLPAPYASVPFSSDMSPEPTYLERTQNIINGFSLNLLLRFLHFQLTSIFRNKYGSDFPSIPEVVRNVDIIFLATDEIIDFSAPTLPNLVNIGGLGVDDDTTEMSPQFEAEMQRGEKGVIYFSLGTIANTSQIDKKVMESFLGIVQKFPDYHFLIRADKYDKNTKERAKGIPNVLVSDWLPQPAILHHPRLRTFITHAGYNGLIEAALAGVPLITIPFMFDQNQNSRAIEKKGWGIRREKKQLLTDPASIEGAIREMLTNPSYTKQAHRIRDLIKSKPMGARDRFIKTTEWVIQNGGVHELLTEGRNLIFSPATSKSHLISNGRIADELARAGHNVTLLELDFLGIVDTTKSSKLVKKTIVRFSNGVQEFRNVLESFSEIVMEGGGLVELLRGNIQYQNSCNGFCAELLEKDDLFDFLKSEKFDGFITEQPSICGIGYAKALGIERRFLISSCPFFSHIYDYTSHPAPYASVPFSSDLSPEPTYLERAHNLLNGITCNILFRYLHSQLTSIFQNKYGSDFPSVTEIVRNVDIIFLATDEIIDFSAPTLPNLVNIGGLGVDDDTTEMSPQFEAEMQKGEKGVIYFSLGTIANTSTIDKKVMESLLGIVQKFPDYHFLVRADKYDKNTKEKAKGIPNLLVSDWLPQPAILHHPRLRTFITHAGYNGLVEAARAGVPLITIPFMFDQNLNSRAIEKKGWGIRMDKKLLLTNPGAIEGAIREMLTNPSYTKQAHRIRDLIKSKPMGARDRFIKTTEWVIQNGGVHELLTEGRNLSVITSYNLDIFVPLFLIILYFIVIPFFKFIGGFYYFSCFGHVESKHKTD